MINVEVGRMPRRRGRSGQDKDGARTKTGRPREMEGKKERAESVIRGPEVSVRGMLVQNEIGSSDHAGRLLGPARPA